MYGNTVLIQPGSVPSVTRGVAEDHLSLQKGGAPKTPVEVGSGPRSTAASEVPRGIQLPGRLGDIERLVHDEAHRSAHYACFSLVDDEHGSVPAGLVDGVTPRWWATHPSTVESLALTSALGALTEEGAFGFRSQDTSLQLMTARLRGRVDVLGG